MGVGDQPQAASSRRTARRLVSVDAWHLEVHQDDVERSRRKRRDRRSQAQRLLSVERTNDLKTQPAQCFLGDQRVDVVVLRDEGATPRR